MPLITPRPEKNYNCTQEELYQVCLLIWDSYIENVTDFTNTNTNYTLAYGQTNRAAVIAAKQLPDFQARNEPAETFLILMKDTAIQCIILWNLLEIHIKKSFPQNLHKPKLEAAGADYYQKAANNNWTALSALMESANKFITQNNAALTTGGMPPTFTSTFSTTSSDFELLHTKFKDAEQDESEQRNTKINANNNLNNTISALNQDAQKIYRDNPAKRERFTFSKVLELVNGGGSTPPSTGSIVAVTNQSILKPVTVDFISRNAGGGEQLNQDWGDGYESPLTMQSGVYTSVSHNFLVEGVYTMNTTDLPGGQAGGVAAIGEIRILSGQVISFTIPDNAWLRNITLSGNPITTFTIPATQTGLMHLDLSSCNLVVDSTNAVLITTNDFGTSGGFIDLSGGTNAAPTGAGLAAKAALIARGWTVVTN